MLWSWHCKIHTAVEWKYIYWRGSVENLKISLAFALLQKQYNPAINKRLLCKLPFISPHMLNTGLVYIQGTLTLVVRSHEMCFEHQARLVYFQSLRGGASRVVTVNVWCVERIRRVPRFRLALNQKLKPQHLGKQACSLAAHAWLAPTGLILTH